MVVIGALIFLFNVAMTVIKGKRTAILGMLLGGLVFLALLYIFGMPFYRNLTIDWFYWWWVVHLWVEGAWELVTAAILAFVLIKITGVDRKVVEKYLYIETALFLFTGLAGTGHHYYWIGAPQVWLWVGGIFSAMEVLPIIAMVIDTFMTQRRHGIVIKEKIVWTFALGTAVGHLIGAGVFGFAHTLPQVNYFTHGSQVTAAHGHLAFFGAYALLNFTMFWYAIPRLRGNMNVNKNVAISGFWLMSLAVLGLGSAMAVAGIIQTYVERVLGDGFMVAQGHMQLWFKSRDLLRSVAHRGSARDHLEHGVRKAACSRERGHRLIGTGPAPPLCGGAEHDAPDLSGRGAQPPGRCASGSSQSGGT